MDYSRFNFVNFKDSALKTLMDKTFKLFDTDIEYIQYTLKETSKEEFIVVLYNLVLALVDIRKKVSYYNMSSLLLPINQLIQALINNMTMFVFNKDYIERKLNEYKEGSRKEIKRYFDILEKKG